MWTPIRKLIHLNFDLFLSAWLLWECSFMNALISGHKQKLNQTWMTQARLSLWRFDLVCHSGSVELTFMFADKCLYVNKSQKRRTENKIKGRKEYRVGKRFSEVVGYVICNTCEVMYVWQWINKAYIQPLLGLNVFRYISYHA